MPPATVQAAAQMAAPGADCGQVNHPAIPKKVHFIWMGRDISPSDMSNILLTAHMNPDYEVNILTDRPMAIFKTLTKMLDAYEEPLHRHLAYLPEKKPATSGNARLAINVRDISSLFETLRSAMPSEQAGREGQQLPGTGAHLEALFHREKNGPYRNFAAACDIARMAILWTQGGVYLDVDVIPKQPLGELSSSIGFKWAVGLFRNETISINGVMASAKGSAPAEWALRQIVKNYVDYDTDRSIYHWYAQPPAKKKKLSGWVQELMTQANATPEKRVAPLLSWAGKRVATDPQCVISRRVDTMALSGPHLFDAMKKCFPPRRGDLFRLLDFGSRVQDKDVKWNNHLRENKGLPPSIQPESVEHARNELKSLSAAPLPRASNWLLMDWDSPPDFSGPWIALKGLRRTSL